MKEKVKMKYYNDSVKGVNQYLDDVYGIWREFRPDEIHKDPELNLVWIAIDTVHKRVQIIFLKDRDSEEITYRTNNWEDYLCV